MIHFKQHLIYLFTVQMVAIFLIWSDYSVIFGNNGPSAREYYPKYMHVQFVKNNQTVTEISLQNSLKTW